MFAIALLCLVILAFLLLFHPTPPPPPPPPPPPQPPPARHVSFSDASYSPPISPSPHRRWSSPLHKRRPSLSDSPPTPLRLVPPTKPRSSSTSDAIHPLKGHIRVPSAPASPRTKFVNPFSKHSRPSPTSLESPTSSIASSSSPQSTARRTLVNKFKSIFKSTPSQPPIVQPSPILNTVNTKFRRKQVPRTQPYGPPWNAPMPVPDFSLSPPRIVSPSSRKSRKSSTYHHSTPPKTSPLPTQISPRTLISELDEKLLLLQQQRANDIIPSSHA